MVGGMKGRVDTCTKEIAAATSVQHHSYITLHSPFLIANRISHPTNGANVVLANATALNQQRKTNREQKKAEEEAMQR